jgi:hypothetical protein
MKTRNIDNVANKITKSQVSTLCNLDDLIKVVTSVTATDLRNGKELLWVCNCRTKLCSSSCSRVLSAGCSRLRFFDWAVLKGGQLTVDTNIKRSSLSFRSWFASLVSWLTCFVTAFHTVTVLKGVEYVSLFLSPL